jgi:hypothetical protein
MSQNTTMAPRVGFVSLGCPKVKKKYMLNP